MALAAYATYADVQGLGGDFSVPSAYSEADVAIELERASRRLDAITHMYFGSEELTLVLNGSGSEILPTLSITRWPILSITNVRWNPDYYSKDYDWVNSGTLISEDDYIVTDSRRALERVYVSNSIRGVDRVSVLWERGSKNYRIVGNFGYGNVPEAIRFACVLLAREIMIPGSSNKYEKAVVESFGDGYMRTRSFRTRTSARIDVRIPPMTGIPAVDDLIEPFIDKTPLMSVIR